MVSGSLSIEMATRVKIDGPSSVGDGGNVGSSVPVNLVGEELGDSLEVVVGTNVGKCEGSNEGETEVDGAADSVGVKLGELLGISEGDTVGVVDVVGIFDDVGDAVGSKLGESLGIADCVSFQVGLVDKVGCKLGDIEADGASLVTRLGLPDGIELGWKL